MTTHREHALLLRLAAAEVAHEPQSIRVIRRILRDLGWTDGALDSGVARLRAVLGGVGMVQDSFREAA